MSDHDEYHVHIAPIGMYIKVFLALFVLTIVTYLVALVDLGKMSDVVAVGIALFKASLVVMFFMHLKYSAKILWLVAVSGLVMTIVMFCFTMSDYVSRAAPYIPYPDAWL